MNFKHLKKIKHGYTIFQNKGQNSHDYHSSHRKSNWQNPTIFLNKKLNKLEIEEKIFNLIKGTYEKSTTISYLVMKRLNASLLRSETRQKYLLLPLPFSISVQFSHSVVSDSLRPHELQHSRPPCPPPTPGVHSNSCPSSWWCHPAISSSVIPFSSCPQSLPASESLYTVSLYT